MPVNWTLFWNAYGIAGFAMALLMMAAFMTITDRKPLPLMIISVTSAIIGIFWPLYATALIIFSLNRSKR